MANYKERTRTNYFHVTDEKRYQELFGRLKGEEDKVLDFTKTDEYGRLFHGSEATAPLIITQNLTCANCKYAEECGKTEDCKEECEAADFDEFVSEMQKILPEDETMIVITSGYEKLRSLLGLLSWFQEQKPHGKISTTGRLKKQKKWLEKTTKRVHLAKQNTALS